MRGTIKTFLAIDTSTDTGLVVLGVGNKLYARTQQEPREHNRFLLSMIEAVLNEAAIKLADVDAFICGVGPGSFVGVRLGVSVMQGLAYVTKKPVYALSSLTLQAQAFFRMHPEIKEVMLCHDARMQAFYLGHYQNQNGIAVVQGQEKLLRLSEQIKLPQGVAVSGNAASLLLEAAEITAPGTPQLTPADLEVQAKQVLKTAKPLSAEQLQPVYLNDESNWQKAN